MGCCVHKSPRLSKTVENRIKIMNFNKLEPLGLTLLAGGLLYSIAVFILNDSNHKFHFIILTLVIFISLFLITGYKYFMYRYMCEKINAIKTEMVKGKKISHSEK